MTITPDKVRALAERMVSFTKQFVEDGREVTPIAFILRKKGGVDIIGLRFTTDEEKDTAFRLVRSQIKDGDGLVTIHDSYIVELKPSEPASVPSKHPRRGEALVVTLYGPDLRESWALKYRRDQGQITWSPVAKTQEFSARIFGDKMDVPGGPTKN